MTTVKVEGLDQLLANLKALPAAIVGKNGGPVRQALYPCAKLIRDDARARCHVDASGTGPHLRDEIILKRDPNPRAVDNAAERYFVTVRYKAKKYANTRRNRRVGRVSQSLLSPMTYQNFGDFYYWRFLEFGTSKMLPKPFLRPAFEAHKDELSQLFVASLSAAIQRIVAAMPK